MDDTNYYPNYNQIMGINTANICSGLKDNSMDVDSEKFGNLFHNQLPSTSNFASLFPNQTVPTLNQIPISFLPQQHPPFFDAIGLQNLQTYKTSSPQTSTANGNINNNGNLRNLQTRIWLQNHPSIYGFNSPQNRVPSVISNISGQSIPDDVSSISQISGLRSDWTNLSISLNGANNLFTNVAMTSPSSSENIDPNKKKAIEQLLSLIEENDNDPEIISRIINALERCPLNIFQGQTFNTLTKGVIKLLMDNQQKNLSNEQCVTLLKHFILISEEKLFKEIEDEVCVEVFNMYCNLLSRCITLSNLLPLLYKLITKNTEIAEKMRYLARNKQFFNHILLILNRRPSKHLVTYSALSIMKKLISGLTEWKEYIVSKNGIETLLALIDFNRNSKKPVRLCALDTLIRLITPASKDELVKCNGHFPNTKARSIFIKVGGVQAMVNSIANENHLADERNFKVDAEMTQRALNCLCTVSAVAEIANLDVVQILDGLLKMIVGRIIKSIKSDLDKERNIIVKEKIICDQFFSMYKSFSIFVSNVIVHSAAAKRHVTLSKHFNYFFISTLQHCINVLKEYETYNSERQKRYEKRRLHAVNILLLLNTGIAALNKFDNTEHYRASQMIAEFNEIKELFFFVFSYQPKASECLRIVQCWNRMLTHGITPNDPNVPDYLFSFIAQRIALREKTIHSTDKDLHLQALQIAIETLAKLLENSPHSEKITACFGQNGYIDLFALLEATKDLQLCVAILTLIDTICAKDYSMRTFWSQNSNVLSIITCCANSTDSKVNELGRLIKQKLEGREGEEYTMFEAMQNIDFN